MVRQRPITRRASSYLAHPDMMPKINRKWTIAIPVFVLAFVAPSFHCQRGLNHFFPRHFFALLKAAITRQFHALIQLRHRLIFFFIFGFLTAR
jgi:hypothetical protein